MTDDAAPGPPDEAPRRDEPRPAEPIPDEPGIRKQGCGWALRWGCLATILPLLVIAVVVVFVWHPWDPFGDMCSKDESHLVDEEARLCYLVPEGWKPMSGEELAENAADNDFAVASSGLHSSDEHLAFVAVNSLDDYLGDVVIDEALYIKAEIAAVSAPLLWNQDHSIESESLTIGDFEAATATARLADPFQVGTTNSILWVRVTVVDFGDMQSVLRTTALVTEGELDDEDGTVAILNDIHESIDVE
jgi:hypothetical protein